MAERGGFEPPIRFYPYNGLANRRLQPLGHLSVGDITGAAGRRETPSRASGSCSETLAQIISGSRTEAAEGETSNAEEFGIRSSVQASAPSEISS